MNKPYLRAPHAEGAPSSPTTHAPNAALLIDFDNVTMGMRSDLSKEMKNLLNSDVIRGKVTVQRAYADWRRYPQYIVPLSEASIDLIFAPAYGSSKKNATDIRMAIDAMELIFVRPEIGTYILLTGDSDFSSLVLKLKEYGKYVIGVGIQESSSDILVQNCDEYYSYTSLSGLRKTTEADGPPTDPWVLVEKAVERMDKRNDVMRSDRLKQVMLEIDGGFDEGSFGYSKFSRFLTEAKSRGLVKLRKLDNGQYEVRPTGGRRSSSGNGGGGSGKSSRRDDSSKKSDRGGRSRSRSSSSTGSDAGRKDDSRDSASDSGDPLQNAYDLLRSTVARLTSGEKDAVRDSDVKRKMLEANSRFDEGELGFSKFSRFLRQADDDDVITLRKRDSGNYEVTIPPASSDGDSKTADQDRDRGQDQDRDRDERRDVSRASGPEEEKRRQEEFARAAAAAEAGEEPGGEDAADDSRDSGGRPRLNPRVQRKGSDSDGGPVLLEGQAVSLSDSGPSSGSAGSSGSGTSSGFGASAAAGVMDPDELGLPTDPDSVVRYLTNSYKGVGQKTAEGLVESFGGDLFKVLQEAPEKIEEAVPHGRAEMVLEGWREDLERRTSEGGEGGDDSGSDDGSDGSGPDGGSSGSRRFGGRRTRRRGGRRGRSGS